MPKLNLGRVVGSDGGFGNIDTVYINDGGAPSVTVEASGEDTAKDFVFTFKNLVRDVATADEVDQIAAGEIVQSSNVITAGVMSSIWAKIKAAFAPKSHTHDASDITAGQLAAALIANGTITADMLAAGAVTTAKIADGAVTNAKLDQTLRDSLSQTVGTAKLADLAVTQAKLAASSVTSSKMADNSVTSAKIADGAVTTADLAAKAVTSAKLADAVWGWQAVGAVSDIGTLYRWGRLGFVEVHCKKTAALAGWKSISVTLPGGVSAAFVARSRLTCEDKPGYECTGRVSDNIFYLENRSSTDWPASSGFYVTGSVVFVIA